MLNDAGKKIVAREARAAAKENRYRIKLGANVDEVAAEVWRTAQAQGADFTKWASAKNYFDAIFYKEIGD